MCKNEYKKREVRQIMDKSADTSQVKWMGGDPGTDTERSMFNDALFKALDKMDADRKTTFLMKYREGFSVEEISAVTDCNIGTVKSRLFYIKKELAKELKAFRP